MMSERTQLEVAASLGISDSTYSDYERGNVPPSLPMLLLMLDILEIDASEILALLDDNDDEPNGAPVAA